MVKKIAAVMTLVALTTLLGVTIYASKDDVAAPANLTVHEWGTFTSVASLDGKAAPWLPLAGPNDLPCFVVHYQNLLGKSVPSSSLTGSLDYNTARSNLLGSIRMETPVLYFYAQEPRKVNVRVAFPQGFVTEWYPQATVNQTPVRTEALQKSRTTGATIEWKNVEILRQSEKSSFPTGSSASHYYAARSTDANPIRVRNQDEKFLFYRGVGGFPVPINVTTEADKIHIKYLAGKPTAILFESRGGKLGYTIIDTSQNEVVLDSPALTGSFESLRRDLEAALVRDGLYAREATAMVDTWRDSWFEEGTRIFYIVPSAMVETILPLSIEPKPAHVARVFVGRVEVLTPTTIKAVEHAIAREDTSILSTYGRFLGPIMERIPALKRDPLLDFAFRQYVEQAASCSK